MLLTHPGLGPVTALATEVFLGDPQGFADGKALASYVGLIPREYSSGAHQRLGALTKQGSPFLRFLWNEAAAHAVRRDPDLQRFYRRKLVQKGLGKSRVAVARKLVAVPVLLGALMRIVTGMLADRFGGRLIFVLLMVVVAVPAFLVPVVATY